MIFINKFNKKIIKNKLFDIDLSKLRSPSFFLNMTRKNKIIYDKFNKYLINSGKIRCLLCEKNISDLYYQVKRYKLIHCKYCFSISANINYKKYNSKLYHKNINKKKFINDNVKKTFEYRYKKFGTERIEYIEKYTSLKKKKKIKILDYGCGMGSFLYSIKNKRKRYLAKGLDFDLNSINYCKSLGLNVDSKNLEDEKNNYYDLITLFDVIEHIQEPKKIISILLKKLKVGGYLIFFTPNLNSLSTILMKDKHNMFAPFDHLCFYSLNSFKFIAKKFNMKLLRFDYFGLDVKDYIQYIEATFRVRVKFNKILNNFSNIIQTFLDSADCSNALRVVMQKK